MAKKTKTKKKSVSGSRSASHAHRHDQNSFLLILAGGFLVIILVMVSFGFLHTARIRQMAAQEMGKITTARETVVTISNNMFTSPVTVQRGTKVTWINNDPFAHTVVADDGSFDLGTVTHDQSKSHVFDTPGTYKYHCSIHEGMEGTIIVE